MLLRSEGESVVSCVIIPAESAVSEIDIPHSLRLFRRCDLCGGNSLLALRIHHRLPKLLLTICLAQSIILYADPRSDTNFSVLPGLTHSLSKQTAIRQRVTGVNLGLGRWDGWVVSQTGSGGVNAMYTMVLMMAMATGGDDLAFGRKSCHGCNGCCGGVVVTSCHGCYSSCHGCYSSCHGCYSSCHGCKGGFFGRRLRKSCHGCNGCIGTSCHGGVVYTPVPETKLMPAKPAAPATPAAPAETPKK